MANKRLQVWFPLLFSIVMVVGVVIGFKMHENMGGRNFFSLSRKSPIQEVVDLVRLRYVDDVNIDSLGNEAINTLLHKLDPHSVYISASHIAYENDNLRGNFSGIGIEFQIFYDTVNVINVLPNGPSDKAGVQMGDRFIAVNDSIIIAGKGIESSDVINLLRGERGSSVKITVLRNDQLIPITINRGTIPIPSVDAAYMINDSTGFIHLNKFAESTYREFMQSLEMLQSKGMHKLIVDLRGNGGGLLSQAVNIADEFLDNNKLIVYTQGSNVPKYEYRAKREGLFERGELVLLIDEGSASASEVLSGALQDWDRATIVGRRSFGKGLVQEQFELSDGSALRLTVARYFTPLGRNIQKSYTEGYDKYEEEIADRFINGEVIKADTVQKTGNAYKTPKGHIVYGGGGITPDVYIPFDTSSTGQEAMKLFVKGTISNFVYTWYVRNKEQFEKFKSTSELAAKYEAGETEWNALKAFATRDSINLSLVRQKDKERILKRIPSLMARQIWRSEGYYKVMNQTDEFVQKALEIINTSRSVADDDRTSIKATREQRK